MENREKLESYEACDFRGAFSSSWIFQEFRSLWCFRRIPEERSSAHRIGICQTLVRRQSGKRVLDSFPRCLVGFDFSFFFFLLCRLWFYSSHTEIGDFWALCQRLAGSIHPRLSCRLCGVLFTRRMILRKIILRENISFYV